MNIRILYNYILNILGIREMLPGEILRSKPVRECNEPMVELTASCGLFTNNELMICRSSVAEKLKKIGSELSKEGLGLYIYELYRTPQQQQAKLDRSYKLLGDKFTDKEELEKYIRRCTAGLGGGHQTGGAVDLTLCDIAGVPLDMGSIYPDKCPEMITSYFISHETKKRRRLLCKMMQKEGFANYPGEWWHFAYGDRLWAAYRYKRYAIYDIVEEL